MDITAIGAFSVNSCHGSGVTSAPLLLLAPRRGERAEANDVDKPLRSPHGGAQPRA